MLDFMTPIVETTNKGVFIRPQFHLKRSKDLLTRGGDFYAIWDEENNIWTKDPFRFLELIDQELYAKRAENGNGTVTPVGDIANTNNAFAYLRQYLKACPDSKANLDEELTFVDDVVTRDMYRSHRLPYKLVDGDTPAWDKLMGTLYPGDELQKLMWAIGAIVSGDSKKLQKFIVIYGEPGSGKSTFLGIVQDMFQGYWSAFSSERLASHSEAFPLEPFKDNPLIGIEHDGDLSHIEDNTKLNSLVSHEVMSVNEKFKSVYNMKFNTFLFMGTNKPVKITDAQSGLIRRLIDVWPGTDRLSFSEYQECMDHIRFEYGAIAKKCLDLYLENTHLEDTYVPMRMIQMTDPFFDFMQTKADELVDPDKDFTTLKAIWAAYKAYTEEVNMTFKWPMMKVKSEAMNYFYIFKDQWQDIDTGQHWRNVYIGLKKDKLYKTKHTDIPKNLDYEIGHDFMEQPSLFDKLYPNAQAQYSVEKKGGDFGPAVAWDDCTTKLKDLDTSREHFVRGLEPNHIVVDFDIKDADGNKSFDLNWAEARKWPATYAELSKSGQGIHLHYIYDGDVTKLAALVKPDVEVKKFTGKSSLRRRLTRCNKLPIATISSGLPMKEEKVVDFKSINDEQHLRNIILKHLRKEIVSSTSQSMSLIKASLDEAYASGIHYDLTTLRPAILTFAAKSTHHARECIAMMNDFKWMSEDASRSPEYADDTLVFIDVEVYPNLFLVVWKEEGEGKKCVIMINPTPLELEPLFERKLIGFNVKRYDNHILYARHAGYNNEALFMLSQRIINGSRNSEFREAENLSYTDIYDFSSKKQSLKKWEIELGIHHQEMGIPWDKPVPEELWPQVADYCCNDVIAAEHVFHHLKADWEARQILATLADSTVNDSTNHLTALIIFGTLHPDKSDFRWRDLATPVMLDQLPHDVQEFLRDNTCLPLSDFIPQAYGGMENPKMVPSISDIPYFPGYAFTAGKSMYRGEDVGSGGYVYAEPGTHWNVALLDIASMHPSSGILEIIFGPRFTKRFKDIKDLRILIKHKDYETVKTMWGGVLAQFVDDPEMAAALAYALKIAINSVYGLTSAVFDNPFRNMENLDNIVAKRGALFMVDLKHAVQEKGFQVAHIKTDSIKIPNATPEIIQFVIDMGHYYGYDFEHEATYSKMALVNNAVYIAKYAAPEQCEEMYGYAPGDNIKAAKKGEPWTATGTQFAVPYVFKSLFSKESLSFGDVCETKQVKVGAIYLDYNENLPDVTKEEKYLADIRKAIAKGEEAKVIGDLNVEAEIKDLTETIASGHNYQFVGRIGLFCPVVDGVGGAQLMCRRDDGTYSAVTGTKGYRWLESDTVLANHLEDKVDLTYYTALVDKAVDAISAVGDIGSFMDS